MPGLYRQRTLEGWGLRHDGGYDGEEYEGLRRGYVFFLFRKKERTKEKSMGSFSRLISFRSILGYGFLYTRGGAACAVSRFFYPL